MSLRDLKHFELKPLFLLLIVNFPEQNMPWTNILLAFTDNRELSFSKVKTFGL